MPIVLGQIGIAEDLQQEAGAEDFLLKPVASDELWLRVRNLLRLKAFGDVTDDMNQLGEAEVLLIRSKSKVDAAMLEKAGFSEIETAVVDRESEAPHFQTLLAVARKPA